MAKIKRGRFTISVNILMTTSLITRNVVMSSMLITVYIIYIVLFAIVYSKRFALGERLYTYSRAFMNYNVIGEKHLSTQYQVYIFPEFINQLGCNAVRVHQYSACYDVYMEKLESYLYTYFGLIVTCIICQVFSVVTVEYIYRKMEVKATSERISNTKYFLLCTFNLGMFRNFTVFIRESFNRSKVVFVSVAIKLFLVIIGTCLLALGLVIIGNEVITDYKLRDIFYRLQFYNLYLYDIITGIVASCIVFGVATVVVAATGLVGSWRKSHRLLLTSTVISVIFQIPKFAALLIWIIFQAKINEELQIQLNIQQTGYWQSYTEWNTMIQTLDCCGVDSTSDTFANIIFCYENVMEIVAYPSEYYDMNILNFLYGTTNKRTTTCTSKISFRIEMMIGWFSAITLLQLLLEIFGIIFVNKELKTNHPTLFVPVQRERTETVEANEKKPQNIVMFLLLLNFGLLFLVLSLRYDIVFGNKFIKDYIFDDIVIAGRSLSLSINYFNIVVTTFSLTSFCIAIYVYTIQAVQFKTHRLLMYLATIFMTILFMTNVIQIGLWGIFQSHVSHYLTSQMKSDIINYHSSDNSYWHKKSVGWNTLFIKSYLQSFGTSLWNRYGRSSAQMQIPIYCCKSETFLYPFTSRNNADCTNTLKDGTFRDIGCDEAIKTRLNMYSISFFVMTGIILFSEIICIIATVHYLRTEPKIRPANNETNDNRNSTVLNDIEPSEPLTSEDDKNNASKATKEIITTEEAPGTSIKFIAESNNKYQSSLLSDNSLDSQNANEFGLSDKTFKGRGTDDNGLCDNTVEGHNTNESGMNIEISYQTPIDEKHLLQELEEQSD